MKSPFRPLDIAVLCGGTSSERDVSLASAAQVVPALRQVGHTVQVVDTAVGLLGAEQERRWIGDGVIPAPDLRQARHRREAVDAATVIKTHAGAYDLVFLALHGGTGEDGTVQALLDVLDVPYTGSGHAASAICMDKDLSKRLFLAAGIRTPDWQCLDRRSSRTSEPPLGLAFPVIVKPNRQGSTIGLSLARNRPELERAIEYASRFDHEVLIETFIAGRELTVGVLEGRPLTVGEILVAQEGVFDFESKYTPGATAEVFPASVPSAVAREAERMALAAHQVLKLDDYSRADFRLDRAGNLWLLEVNSLPGLTTTSLLPQSAAASGIAFAELCDRICRLALARRG